MTWVMRRKVRSSTPLVARDDDLAGVHVGAETGEGGAQELGGDDGDDDFGVGDGGFVAGDGDVGGQGKAGEEEDVLAARRRSGGPLPSCATRG